MFVVTIIGIQATAAMAAYKDYTIRAKVTELVLAAATFKTSIAEKAVVDGSLAKAGVGLTVVPTAKISSGRVDNNGYIEILGNSATIGAPVLIMLVPTLATNAQVTWICYAGHQTLPDNVMWKYAPAGCRQLGPGRF